MPTNDQSFGRNYQFGSRIVIHLYRQMHRAPRSWNVMRDFIADWKKWSAAERVLAAAVTLAMVAVITIGTVSV
jgi:hypothetical protein